MATITRTYTFTDGTTAYGSQVEVEVANIVTVFNNHDSGSSTWTQVKSALFLGPAGSFSAPSYSSATDTDTGMYFSAANEISFAVGGLIGLTLNSNQQGLFRAGTNALPSASFSSETDCGMFVQGTNAIGFSTNAVEVMRWDASVTASHVRLLVYDVNTSTLSRVTVGANDSGGAGFKYLRIPN